MEIKQENGFYSVQQKILYDIVKKEDEVLIEVLKDYARKNNAELRLLDEEKVKEIIKKGLTIYHAEEHKSYSHSYISKNKIEDKIKELENKSNLAVGLEGCIYRDTIQILKEILEG